MSETTNSPRGIVIGIAGVARSGKDTAGHFVQELLYERNKELSKQCGFADLLKKDMEKFCREQFGFTSFTKEDHQKEMIRPLLVAYGTHVWRKQNENHWVEKMKPTVDFFTSAGHNVIITDVRYENEIDWIQKELSGRCIFVSRKGAKPANKEEADQCPLLKEKADTLVSWPTFGEAQINKAKPKIIRALNRLNLLNV
jgi:hypothetical protein|tara:strand:- start:12959 stop:13552 length:594 start_codon:yes stop_codon:yes gene_type:complete